MLNRIAGIFIYLLAYTPLLLIQTGLVLLMFIDKVIAGEYLGAVKTLLFSPFKVLTMLYMSITHIVVAGWGKGFTGFFDFSFARIKTYWIDFYNTDPKYFSAIFHRSGLDFYTGDYVGAVAHKVSLLFFPSYFFDFYKNYEYSPHNPVVTYTANNLYDLVDKNYGKKTRNRINQIPQEIELFLNDQATASPNDQTFTHALSCLKQLRTGLLTQVHDLKTNSAHNVTKTPINVLCLVWIVIQDYRFAPTQELKLKKLVATYLANMQRNLSTSDSALDLEECGTGMINSFLEILKAVDAKRFTLQLPKTDSWGKIKTLLKERMDQQYYIEKNAHSWAIDLIQKHLPRTEATPQVLETRQLNPTQEEEKKATFIKDRRSMLGYYGRFLNSTPQGRRITGLGHLDDAGLDTTVDTVLEEWNFPAEQVTRV